MCHAIPGNFVRPRTDVKVTPHAASRGDFPPHREFFLNPHMCGIVDEAPAADPGSLVVAFPWDGSSTLCAELPRHKLKGVEF